MFVRNSNIINSFILGLIIVTSFTGCAGLFNYDAGLQDETPSDQATEKTAELTDEELNKYNEEWEDIKLKVERLVKIEDDLALIMQEVGKSSDLKNMPPEYGNKTATDFIEAEYDDAELPVESLNMEPKRQYYAANLGLFLRKDNAKMGWKMLQHRYPKIFNQLTPLVKEIKRSDQVIYSLIVGPFDDLETSNLVCNIFVQYKYKCEPTEYNGEEI